MTTWTPASATVRGLCALLLVLALSSRRQSRRDG